MAEQADLAGYFRLPALLSMHSFTCRANHANKQIPTVVSFLSFARPAARLACHHQASHYRISNDIPIACLLSPTSSHYRPFINPCPWSAFLFSISHAPSLELHILASTRSNVSFCTHRFILVANDRGVDLANLEPRDKRSCDKGGVISPVTTCGQIMTC